LYISSVILALSQKVSGELEKRSKDDEKYTGLSLQGMTNLRTILLGGAQFWQSQIWEDITVICEVTDYMEGINKEQLFIASFST